METRRPGFAWTLAQDRRQLPGPFANAMVLQGLLHIAVLCKARRIGGALTDRLAECGPHPAEKPPPCGRCFSLPPLMRAENRLFVH